MPYAPGKEYDKMTKEKVTRERILRAVQTDPEVSAEFRRLSDLFGNADESSKTLLSPLIARASFLSVEIDKLEQTLLEKGFGEEYRNGQNQSGRKQTPEAQIYPQLLKLYVTVMKSLQAALNLTDSGEEPDEFDLF